MYKTRKEALLNNETKYFTTIPCVKGHLAARRAKTGECLECRALFLAKWRNKNPHKVKEHNATQYLKYEIEKHKWKARAQKYLKNNKDKANARTVAYQLAKANRVPLWADKNKIKELYKKAVLKSIETGIQWHVDHIVPLRGKLVSGLHVPENLRVIPGIENVKKANRYIIE
jgi:hypothetical protein